MKTLIAFALGLVLAAPCWATTYAFRCTNWPVPIEGYIDSSVGQGDGFGAMWVAGEDKNWWLTGFDSWWHSPPMVRDGWHQCLVIHPDMPWIVGTIIWQGTHGRMDILSTDGTRFEFELTVEIVMGGTPDDKRAR